MEALTAKKVELPICGKTAVISARPFTGDDRINTTRMARVTADDSVYVFATLLQHARMALLLTIDGRQLVPEDLGAMDERDIMAIEETLKGDPRFPQEKKAVPPTIPPSS
jgi:hypothetical protein